MDSKTQLMDFVKKLTPEQAEKLSVYLPLLEGMAHLSQDELTCMKVLIDRLFGMYFDNNFGI